MKKRLMTVVALACGLTLTGCETVKSGNVGGLLEGGSTAMKAMSLSDSDIVTLSNESCEAMDAQSKIAPANSKYTQRLNKVISGMPGTINGKKAVYKVYMTEDVNAWAMANGCIRVYSGLMDLMNDDELRGVIGHEIGHVGLGHSRRACRPPTQRRPRAPSPATAAARSLRCPVRRRATWPRRSSTPSSRNPRNPQPTTIRSTC